MIFLFFLLTSNAKPAPPVIEVLKTPSTSLYWYSFLRKIPRKMLLSTLFYGVSRILISAAWPYLLYHYLQKSVHYPAAQIAAIVGVVVLMFVLSGVASHRQSVINIAIMKNYSLKLVQQLWEKMTGLDWLTFHGKNRVYFFDMLMVDAWRLRLGMIALLESVIINSVIAGALTIFIAFISFPLFVLCALGLGFTAGIHFYSTTKLRPRLKHFHNAWRRQHHWMAKVVDQFDLIKMGRGYNESAAANHDETSTFLNANAEMLNSQSQWRAINQVVGNMIRVVIFITGIYWVQTGYIKLTDLLLVLLIVSIVQNNVMQVPGALNNFIEGQEAAASITGFLALPEETPSVELPAELSPVEKIDISGLAYTYQNKPAIEGIDIHLEKGKIYLWKGANGSGKSTTAHILLGLLKPREGSLKINGVTADWDTLRQLRRRFAFVNQDVPLFMGTVKENVLFGHPTADEAWGEVHNNWLSGLLPQGYQQPERLIGDRGEGLSGGEARRLALIREWIRSADVFILDEPLNHLDEHTIMEIRREIINLKSRSIVIIISHQSGFEAIADEIKQF